MAFRRRPSGLRGLPPRRVVNVTEYKRLLREIQAAETTEQVHSVLRMSSFSTLSAEEKVQLFRAVPQRLRAPTAPEDALPVIRTLESINIHSGRALKWSKETPWRENPWQLIQISAARAILACRPMFPASDWGALATAARCVAVHGQPSKAWPYVLESLKQYPSGSARFAGRVALRLLLTAWTTMEGRQQPGADLRRWVRSTMLAQDPALPAAMLEQLGDAAQAFVGLTPEAAVAEMERLNWTCAAMPEVVVVLAVHCHLNEPASAEALLNRMLTRGD